MERILKIIGCISMLNLFFSLHSFAQEQEKNEISVVAGGGISTLYYSMGEGKYKFDCGGTAGIGYHFFFNEIFSIGTGAEFACYRSKGNLNPISGNFWFPNNLNLSYTLTDYAEKQTFVSVNIPLMFQVQYPLFFEDHFCYAAIGGRMGIPVQVGYETSGSKLTTGIANAEGVFQETGNYIEKPVKKYTDYNRVAYMLSAEVGMKWNTSGPFSIYTGLYFDYGLNRIVKPGYATPFLLYNENDPSNFTNNSITESVYMTNDGDYHRLTSRVIPIALGLKVRLSFRIPDPCYK